MKTATRPTSVALDRNGGTVPVLKPPPLPAPKRRPRRALLAAGVVLVVLGALATYWLTQQSSQRVAVVGVAHDMSWGQVITAADLVQVQIAVDPQLTPIPWSQEATLIGQRAAVDLQAGSLLTPRSVTDQQVPPAGSALVGVSVKSPQLPVTALTAGDKVLLVITPAGTAAQQAAAATVSATVFAVGAADASGARTVDVLVDQGDAAGLAQASAAGRVAIVLVPRR